MSIVKSNPSSYPSIFNGLFERFPFLESEFFKPSKLPATNVKENEKNFQLEFAIPGFKKEEIKINLEDDVLSVSAESKNEKNENNENFSRKEFSYSSFKRQFQLPANADKEKVDARYENGILVLTIDKKSAPQKEDKTKLIPIK